MQQQRQLNIELLRIFSMFLITLEHVGFLKTPNLESSISGMFLSYAMIFILFHVDLFILITGYFGIKHSKRPLVKNILLLYFYSITLSVFTWAITGNFCLADALLPITHSNWWFMRMYIVMLLIAPIIEYYVKDCTRIGINLMLMGALFVNIYLSHFNHVGHIYDSGFGLVNFVCVYIIGVWIRKEGVFLVRWLKHPRLSIFITILVTLAIQYKSMPFFSSMTMTEYCGLYSTFMAVLIFLLFINIKISECFRKVIIFFSSSAVAVYLITENFAIREMLRPLFNIWYLPYQNSLMGIVIILLSVVIAYVTCCVIDKVRIPVTDYLTKKIMNIPFINSL